MEIGATDAALALTVATGRLVAPSQRRILLPAENLRAEAEMATEPARAAQRLQRALSMPCADRLLHPHLERSHILLGQVALALGDAQAARDASAVARYSVTLEAQALVIRLRAAALDGEDDPAAVTSALRLLESDRLSPLHALPLMRTVAARTPSRRGRAPFPRRRLQETAQSLADSLRSAPALQAAFIRKHRDLLT